MIIKNYISKIITAIREPKNKVRAHDYSINLNDHIKQFTYIACAISKDDIEIITSKDEIGGYYEKKIILPQKINIAKKKSTNLLCYLYKLVFSLTSRKLNFYLPENKNKLDYILLASILTVKTINKHLYNTFPKIKDIKKIIYPKIIKMRPEIEKLNQRALLLEIIIRKLTYQKVNNKIKLEQHEKLWLYAVENIKNITDQNIKIRLKMLYIQLCNIHKNYINIEFNQLWGYLYYKEKHIKDNFLKKNTTLHEYKNKNNLSSDLSVKIKKSKIESKTEKKNNLTLLFDYKKTKDKYRGGNKNTEADTADNLDILNDLDIDNVTRNNTRTESIFSSNIINSILINKLEANYTHTKKFVYKEWNFETKQYKQNWCSLFLRVLVRLLLLSLLLHLLLLLL